jgi:TP901 family phage tail tape measure protein
MALTMNDKMGVLISTALNPADIQRIRNQINNLKSQALKKPLALNIDTKNTSSSLNKTIKQTKQMETGLKGVGQQAKSALGKFSLWMGVSTIFFGAVAAIKSMTDAVIRLDTALLEANKVLDLTKGQMALLTEEAFKVGEQIGRTGTEVVEATSDWARMGFTMRESLDLAEQSLLFLNIGDGIDSVEQSTKTLIATMKGFSMDAKDVNKIVDILNETSNRFALNTDDIAEGMRRVSAVMNQSGNSIEQTTGLLTAAIEVLQDAPKAATGLRTISQRLRSVGEEGEYLGGVFTAKLQNAFKNIAGVDIMQNGQLRSTYEILIDLSKAWGNLTNEQKQYLGELAAGKRQIQTFLAIMQNGDTIINATETALNSQGSALRENEKYLDSINGRIAVFNSTLEQLWNDTLSSDAIKRLVDFGTSLLKIADAVGLVNIVATVLVALTIKKLITTIPILAQSIVLLSNAMGIAVGTASALSVALGGILIVGVIAGAIALINKFTVSTEELKKETEKLTGKVQELKEELKALQEIEGVSQAQKDRIKALKDEIELRERLIKLNKIEVAQSIIEDAKKVASKQPKPDELFSFLQFEGAEGGGLLFDLKRLQKEFNEYKSFTDQINELDKSQVVKKVELYNQQKSMMAEISKGQLDLVESIKELGSAYELLVEEDILEEVPDVVKELGESYAKLADDISWSLGEMGSAFVVEEPKVKSFKDEVKSLNETISESSEKIDKNIEDLENRKDLLTDIASIYQEVVSGEKLSLITITDLINKYPEYASQFAKLNEVGANRATILKNVWEIERNIQAKRYTAQQKELEEQYENMRKLQKMTDITAYMSGIDTEEMKLVRNQIKSAKAIVALYLKDIDIDDFTKNRTKTPSTPKDSYIPSIEKYQDLSSALEDINFLLTKNNSLIAQSEGEDKINLLKERVELLKEQQQVMHLLNNARDKEIIQNIEILKQNGFIIDYNKDTNQLLIKNEEHLLNINQKKIKDIEKIIDLVKSLNKENISGSSEWFTIQNEINDLLDEQIDITKELAKVKEDKLVKDSENIVKAETLITQAIKESLNTQKDALEQERNNLEEKKTAKLKELNNEREAAKTKLQIIKDAKDKEFDILIDAKNKAKQALREEFEEDNYQKALKKEQDELLKLEEEYNKIATDNSGLYEKEKLELQEQIAEKRASIQDTILEHGIEKLEDTIDKEIDAIEKQRTQEQEIYDNKLDNLKTFYDDKEGEAERHYNLLIDKAESKIEELESILANESQKLSNQISSMMELTQLEILKFLQDNLSEYKIAGENLAKALLEGYLETLEEAGFDSNLDLGGLNSDVGGLSLNNSGLSGLSGLSNQNNNTQSINVEQLLVQVDQLVEEQDFEGLANKIRNILTSSSRGTSRSVARR